MPPPHMVWSGFPARQAKENQGKQTKTKENQRKPRKTEKNKEKLKKTKKIKGKPRKTKKSKEKRMKTKENQRTTKRGARFHRGGGGRIKTSRSFPQWGGGDPYHRGAAGEPYHRGGGGEPFRPYLRGDDGGGRNTPAYIYTHVGGIFGGCARYAPYIYKYIRQKPVPMHAMLRYTKL